MLRLYYASVSVLLHYSYVFICVFSFKSVHSKLIRLHLAVQGSNPVHTNYALFGRTLIHRIAEC